MAPDREHVRFLLDLLRPLGPIEPKRLFGTTSFTFDGCVFGIVYDERLFLKVDERTRPDFEAAGQEPFQYSRKGQTAYLRSFYTMPDSAYDEPEEALDWARRAIDAAMRSQAAKKPKQPRAKSMARAGRKSDRLAPD